MSHVLDACGRRFRLDPEKFGTIELNAKLEERHRIGYNPRWHCCGFVRRDYEFMTPTVKFWDQHGTGDFYEFVLYPWGKQPEDWKHADQGSTS